jgi:hypothetical protein
VLEICQRQASQKPAVHNLELFKIVQDGDGCVVVDGGAACLIGKPMDVATLEPFRDESGVAERRISRRRRGERLRCFGRAQIGSAQGLLV